MFWFQIEISHNFHIWKFHVHMWFDFAYGNLICEIIIYFIYEIYIICEIQIFVTDSNLVFEIQKVKRKKRYDLNNVYSQKYKKGYKYIRGVVANIRWQRLNIRLQLQNKIITWKTISTWWRKLKTCLHAVSQNI